MFVCVCMCMHVLTTYMCVCLYVCGSWEGKKSSWRRQGTVESTGIHVMINWGGALTRGQEPASRRKRAKGRELTRTSTITPKYEDAARTPIVWYANSKSKKKGRKWKMHKKWATPRRPVGSQLYPLWCVTLGESVSHFSQPFFFFFTFVIYKMGLPKPDSSKQRELEKMKVAWALTLPSCPPAFKDTSMSTHTETYVKENLT